MRTLEASQREAVRAGEIPNHIGCIMDGNGRWALMRWSDGGDMDASSEAHTRVKGHRAAEEAVISTIDAALELGVKWLSVYAFSTENWARDQVEVSFLMSFDEWLLRKERRDELNKKGVRIRFVGRLDDPRIPLRSREWLAETEELTAYNERLTLCIALNYGGRSEIIDAVERLVALRSTDSTVEIDEAIFSSYMYAADMPDIDLLIRTSGEQRLSNFFPWHSTYAELVFIDTLWPDFRGWHLYSAVAEYQTRRRRKGAAGVERGG